MSATIIALAVAGVVAIVGLGVLIAVIRGS
jgi:hypothetical protein